MSRGRSVYGLMPNMSSLGRRPFGSTILRRKVSGAVVDSSFRPLGWTLPPMTTTSCRTACMAP